MEGETSTEAVTGLAGRSELDSAEADAVVNVAEWMRFLLLSASTASAKQRVILFQTREGDEVPVGEERMFTRQYPLSDENFFRVRDGFSDPVLFSTLAQYAWMIPSDKIVMPVAYQEEWNACCVALSSFFALEIMTSTIYPLPEDLNVQPLDVVVVAGETCRPVGRLELRMDGNFDKILYRSLGSLGVRSAVLPHSIMLRNCLPRLGCDVVRVILQFVGSPFLNDPPVTINSPCEPAMSYENNYGCSGYATYNIKYSKDALGAQVLSVFSDLTSQSMFDRIERIDTYSCSWHGDGCSAKVVRTELHYEQRRTDTYDDDDYMYYYY